MRKFITKIIIFSVVLLIGLSSIAYSANLQDAFKTSEGSSKDPLDAAAGAAGYNIKAQEGSATLEGIISTIIQTALSFLGIVFLILMIYGGYLWMTARGNEQQVEKAKNLLTAAIVGLIIVLAAYTISYFVIQMLGEQTLKPAQ
ncbi:pilin [Patescibacteria group bacterium]|nr:pilin [Patescibacteria group bacterium]MBU4455327.1 pilin [Patescibacteria group bacterium]MCG2690960.1 pilin [Candidatus Parcubacteria bacterium]